MEYASNIDGDLFNDEFIKHVGYNYSYNMNSFFSKNNIKKISRKITELLMGVDKYNRRIIVPDKTIKSVMSSVYHNFTPEIGDIFGRYNIPKINDVDNIQMMIDEVINIITTDVKVNLGMDECNQKLTVWTTVLGDFNEHGLRSHSKIKLKENRPMPLMFNMNY